MGKVWIITRNESRAGLIGTLAYPSDGDALRAALEQLAPQGRHVRDYIVQHDAHNHVWYVGRDEGDNAPLLALRIMALDVAVDGEGPF